MARPRLLVLKAGDTVPPVLERHGDFDAIFRARFAEAPVDVLVVDVPKGEAIPAVGQVDLALITGSPHSVTTPERWTHDLAEWTREAVAAGRPLLGVCYGHQLLAWAAGGEVTQNPAGYEIGTIEVELTPEGEADPLLGRLGGGAPLAFQAVHADAVVGLPEGARVLARNERTAVQAFALGERAWGVQFHPEFDDDVMRRYVQAREGMVRAAAAREDRDPEEVLAEVRARIRPTPLGQRLLLAFVERARAILG